MSTCSHTTTLRSREDFVHLMSRQSPCGRAALQAVTGTRKPAMLLICSSGQPAEGDPQLPDFLFGDPTIMAEPGPDIRSKNYKLEKQDEVELSDDEAAASFPPQQHSPGQQHRHKPQPQQSPAHLGGVDQPLPVIISPSSASSENDRRGWNGRLQASSLGEEASPSGRTVPLASMQIVNSGNGEKRRHDSIPTPKHHNLGSLAFSSMSTEETSSIADTEALSRYMGSISVQESLQDDGGKKDGSTLDFLISTWHQQPQDRLNMLRFEKMLEEMLERNNTELCVSPPLNSYYRMLLHRLAEVWDFEHNTCYVKGTQAQGVSVKLTLRSARPDHLFREMPEPIMEEPDMGRVILQRPKTHMGMTEGQFKGQKAAPGRHVQSMSLQERQANYDQVRQRIFGESEEMAETADSYPYSQEADGGRLASGQRKHYGGSPGAARGRNYSGEYHTSTMSLNNSYSGQQLMSSGNMMPNYGSSPFGVPCGDGWSRPDVNGGYPYGATPYNYYMPQSQSQMPMESNFYGQQQQQSGTRMMQPAQATGPAGSYMANMGYPGQVQYPQLFNMYPLSSSYGQPMYLPEDMQYQMQMAYGNSMEQPSGFPYQSPMQPYGHMPFVQQQSPIKYAGPPGLLPTPEESGGNSSGPSVLHGHSSPVERSLSQGPESGPDDSMIIPLRLPGVKGERPNMNLGMYLKLPCLRSKTQPGEESVGDERASSGSRNSGYSPNQDF